MKKKLEAELMSLAHRILKLSGKEDIDKMHKEVAQLYEKITVLKFAKENFEDDMPTIGDDSSFFNMLDTAFNNRVSDTIVVDDKTYINVDEVEDEALVEPVMDKIKNMVAFMPENDEDNNSTNTISTNGNTKSITFENIVSDFKDLPEFEPVDEAQQNLVDEKKKSLNDKLKSNSLHFGLNDRIAFINALFNGKQEDFDRVVSQVNTANTFLDAQNLIYNYVKPEYNNWLGKEDYEQRFMELIESKFN